MKSIFKSKTFWINLLMAAAVIVPELASIEALKIPIEAAASIVGIVNVILRYLTKEGVHVIPPKE